MNAYFLAMDIGALIIFALYGLFCALSGKNRQIRKAAWLTALLALVFCAWIVPGVSRVGFAFMTGELDPEYGGLEMLETLFDFQIEHFSFFCGGAGLLLGVLIANALMRRESLMAGMDAFAPFGAMLAALFRIGEITVPSYGGGHFLEEGSPFAFFPMALRIETAGGYSEWVWAVCIYSAICALICMGAAFLLLHRGARTGTAFTATLFFLCLSQIVCESMRNGGIYWLFVHAEQVLCAVVALGVMLYWIIGAREVPAVKRWIPFAVLAAGFGLVAATEFAIDGKLFDLPVSVCYVFMIIVVAGVGFAGFQAARRWNACKG